MYFVISDLYRYLAQIIWTDYCYLEGQWKRLCINLVKDSYSTIVIVAFAVDHVIVAFADTRPCR